MTTGTAAFAAGGAFAAEGYNAVGGTAAFVAAGAFEAEGVATLGGSAAFSAGAAFSATGYTAPITGTAAFAAGGAFVAVCPEPAFGTAAFAVAAAFAASIDAAEFAAAATFTAVGFVGVQGVGQGRWLYVHTRPPAQIYNTDAVRDRLAPALPMHRADLEVTATAAQIGTQNDAFSIRLSGISAALRARLAAQAPYGVRIDVMDGGEISRSGIVGDIGNAADGSIDIDCEAQGWTTALPLRTNADLGIYRDIEVLPWRYGRAVPGRCIRLGQSGKRWLWADHASERISSVQIDGQDYGAWQWRNDVDGNGNPITIITTADAIDEGAELVAVGDGKRDSRTGALIVNPADMVFDICQVAGRSVDRGDLVPLRAECEQRGIEVSGTVDAGTAQSVMVQIAESIYAVFSRELPGLMRLLPRSNPTLSLLAQHTPTARAQRESIATRLRVRYAVEDSQPRGNLEVRAAGVEALRGISSADVTLELVRDARVALDVATRMLTDRARPAYVVPSEPQAQRLVPGDVVTVSVAALGLSGPALVESSRIDEDGSTPTLRLHVGPVPAITLAAVSAAYAPAQYAGATVTAAGGLIQILVTGIDGRPLAGARCTLDGAVVRTADGAGVVAFPASVMQPGPHTILIESPGMTAQTITVTAP